MNCKINQIFFWKLQSCSRLKECFRPTLNNPRTTKVTFDCLIKSTQSRTHKQPAYSGSLTMNNYNAIIINNTAIKQHTNVSMPGETQRQIHNTTMHKIQVHKSGSYLTQKRPQRPRFSCLCSTTSSNPWCGHAMAWFKPRCDERSWIESLQWRSIKVH